MVAERPGDFGARLESDGTTTGMSDSQGVAKLAATLEVNTFGCNIELNVDNALRLEYSRALVQPRRQSPPIAWAALP